MIKNTKTKVTISAAMQELSEVFYYVIHTYLNVHADY